MATNQVFAHNDVAGLYENNRGDTAASYGFDNILRDLADDMNLWNLWLADMMGDVANPVFVQMQARGLKTNGYFQELDEYGRPMPQKGKLGGNVAFPIRRYADAIGFTELFLAKASLGEVESKYNAARKRHALTLWREMQRAMFTFDSNKTFNDKLSTPVVSLSVKGFLNADGDVIADSRDFTGSTPEFTAASHDHYLGITGSAVSSGEIDNLVSLVTEHDIGMTRLYISQSDYSTISALSGFKAGFDAGLLLPGGATTQTLAARPVDYRNLDYRWVGYWQNSACEIWVHPLSLQNYVLCLGIGESENALGFRQFDVPSLQGLRLIGEEREYPLRNVFMEHYFGFGVQNREAGAILDINTGSGTYTAPTIAKSPVVE